MRWINYPELLISIIKNWKHPLLVCSMPTEFKLLFEGDPDLKMNIFQRSLPPDFLVESRDDGIYVTVKSTSSEDERCQYLVDREFDRHYFLTNVRIRAEMVRSRVTVTFPFRWTIQGALPENIQPQKWNYELPLKLRLWSIVSTTDDVRMKLLLLFQIIELAFPKLSYPNYTDPTKPPDPLVECKFVRHLVAHSGDADAAQLKTYCQHLGFPEVMLDITDPEYYKVIASKVPLMEAEARKVIEKAIWGGTNSAP